MVFSLRMCSKAVVRIVKSRSCSAGFGKGEILRDVGLLRYSKDTAQTVSLTRGQTFYRDKSTFWFTLDQGGDSPNGADDPSILRQQSATLTHP